MKLAKWSMLCALICQSLFLDAYVPGTFQQVTGSPFAAGSAPATSPLVAGNLFAAIPNYYDSTVSVYQVDQTTGAFTQVSGSPFNTGGNPAWQSYSPLASGNLFSAVANYNDNTISVYGVNQARGAFTEIVGAPFATALGPYTVAFTPLLVRNLFAGVTNFSGNTISVYQVNLTTGAFTSVAGTPFATGSGPYKFAFSPLVEGNLFAATVNLNDNTASVFQVNQTTGGLTEIAGSLFDTGSGPNEIAFSPVTSEGLFAPVVNFNSNDVSVYVVDQTSGTFTFVVGAPFATGLAPDGIAFSPILSGGLYVLLAINTSNLESTLVSLKP